MPFRASGDRRLGGPVPCVDGPRRAVVFLPDIDDWARVVAGFLKPGGALYMREGHPMMWAMEWRDDDELLVVHEGEKLAAFDMQGNNKWRQGQAPGGGLLRTIGGMFGFGQVVPADVPVETEVEMAEIELELQPAVEPPAPVQETEEAPPLRPAFAA